MQDAFEQKIAALRNAAGRSILLIGDDFDTDSPKSAKGVVRKSRNRLANELWARDARPQ
jgi:hypothetical protein